MKSLSSEIIAAKADGKLCTCVKITCKDGDILTFTDHDTSLTIGPYTYDSVPGLERLVMNLRANSETSIQQLVQAWVVDLPETELFAGKFDNATIEVFKTGWDIDFSVYYIAEAVTFDGSNDYLTRSSALSGATDNNKMLFSMWVNLDATMDGADAVYVDVLNSGTQIIRIEKTSPFDFVRFSLYTSGGTLMYNTLSTSQYTSADGWVHILFSRSSTTCHMYINDVDVGDVPAPGGSNNTPWTANQWSIGAKYDGTLKFDGDVAELYLTNEYLDLSVEANRRKFISSYGIPVNLGVGGETPTGKEALVYIKGSASVWNAGTNTGTGGDFTMNGSVTDSSSEPVDIAPGSPSSPYDEDTFKLPVNKGNLGLVQWSEDGFRAEIQNAGVALRSRLTTPVTANCRHQLYGVAEAGKIGSCQVTQATFTKSGTVATVTTQKMVFTGTATGESDGWANDGIITFTSGNNNGLSVPIKTHTVGGTDTYTFKIPSSYTITVGDTYNVIAGCDKTLATCKAKFSNVVNFGGFPHKPADQNLR